MTKYILFSFFFFFFLRSALSTRLVPFLGYWKAKGTVNWSKQRDCFMLATASYYILGRDGRVQEEQALNFFLSGLVDELQLPVRMFKPRTLSKAYSLARLQKVTMATIRNDAEPDTKLTTFINILFPPSAPSNSQSDSPKLTGDKSDFLNIPMIQLPKLGHHENFKSKKSNQGTTIDRSSLPKSVMVYERKAHVLATKIIEQHKKKVGGKKQYRNYGNYGEFDLGAHEKYRNYGKCVEFDLSDHDFGIISHDYITLKEDEFERWKRQRKKFYGRVDLPKKK
ncbi:hypothetical protein GH714_037038 [Hevea brasiliensis]|uniref:Uncharacterized protein n=1 Tax=Hevea brasiliensis TaxID=3981 RepID=A0A6A6MJV1_HEVBR|nr:hypothetical protein GH714_037038 [Hevea brasiliensis]